MITDNIGLYIHIPFCRSKCPYCNFYSVGCNSELINKYKSKIIDTVKESPYCFDTVYFGGGTPSSIGSSALAELSDILIIQITVRLPLNAIRGIYQSRPVKNSFMSLPMQV